jgi:hypothetical protein
LFSYLRLVIALPATVFDRLTAAIELMPRILQFRFIFQCPSRQALCRIYRKENLAILSLFCLSLTESRHRAIVVSSAEQPPTLDCRRHRDTPRMHSRYVLDSCSRIPIDIRERDNAPGPIIIRQRFAASQ